MKKTHDGSLFIGILVALLFLSMYMGTVIRNASLFSSFALKKQMYMMHIAATDALLQYGITHVAQHYDALLEKNTPVTLIFPSWPGSLQSKKDSFKYRVEVLSGELFKGENKNGHNAHGGTILITHDTITRGYTIKATLSEQNQLLQAMQCSVVKNTDKTLSVSNWGFVS